jgi:hypothetical protein
MPIITAYYIALALFLGYVVAVGLAMAATFGITAVSRDFVTKDDRVRTRYKYVQEAVWLVCATAGGYVAAMIHGRSHPWVVGVGLVAVLVGVLWTNVWEMRQRGLGHQISMSIVSAGGVAVGFLLRLR